MYNKQLSVVANNYFMDTWVAQVNKLDMELHTVGERVVNYVESFKKDIGSQKKLPGLKLLRPTILKDIRQLQIKVQTMLRAVNGLVRQNTSESILLADYLSSVLAFNRRQVVFLRQSIRHPEQVERQDQMYHVRNAFELSRGLTAVIYAEIIRLIYNDFPAEYVTAVTSGYLDEQTVADSLNAIKDRDWLALMALGEMLYLGVPHASLFQDTFIAAAEIYIDRLGINSVKQQVQLEKLIKSLANQNNSRNIISIIAAVSAGIALALGGAYLIERTHSQQEKAAVVNPAPESNLTPLSAPVLEPEDPLLKSELDKAVLAQAYEQQLRQLQFLVKTISPLTTAEKKKLDTIEEKEKELTETAAREAAGDEDNWKAKKKTPAAFFPVDSFSSIPDMGAGLQGKGGDCVFGQTTLALYGLWMYGELHADGSAKPLNDQTSETIKVTGTMIAGKASIILDQVSYLENTAYSGKSLLEIGVMPEVIPDPQSVKIDGKLVEAELVRIGSSFYLSFRERHIGTLTVTYVQDPYINNYLRQYQTELVAIPDLSQQRTYQEILKYARQLPTTAMKVEYLKAICADFYIYSAGNPLLIEQAKKTGNFFTWMNFGLAGDCDMLATQFVYLLRACGIPAAILTGYMGAGELTSEDMHQALAYYDDVDQCYIFLEATEFARENPDAGRVLDNQADAAATERLYQREAKLVTELGKLSQEKLIIKIRDFSVTYIAKHIVELNNLLVKLTNDNPSPEVYQATLYREYNDILKLAPDQLDSRLEFEAEKIAQLCKAANISALKYIRHLVVLQGFSQNSHITDGQLLVVAKLLGLLAAQREMVLEYQVDYSTNSDHWFDKQNLFEDKYSNIYTDILPNIFGLDNIDRNSQVSLWVGPKMIAFQINHIGDDETQKTLGDFISGNKYLRFSDKLLKTSGNVQSIPGDNASFLYDPWTLEVFADKSLVVAPAQYWEFVDKEFSFSASTVASETLVKVVALAKEYPEFIRFFPQTKKLNLHIPRYRIDISKKLIELGESIDSEGLSNIATDFIDKCWYRSFKGNVYVFLEKDQNQEDKTIHLITGPNGEKISTEDDISSSGFLIIEEDFFIVITGYSFEGNQKYNYIGASPLRKKIEKIAQAYGVKEDDIGIDRKTGAIYVTRTQGQKSVRYVVYPGQEKLTKIEATIIDKYLSRLKTGTTVLFDCAGIPVKVYRTEHGFLFSNLVDDKLQVFMTTQEYLDLKKMPNVYKKLGVIVDYSYIRSRYQDDEKIIAHQDVDTPLVCEIVLTNIYKKIKDSASLKEVEMPDSLKKTLKLLDYSKIDKMPTSLVTNKDDITLTDIFYLPPEKLIAAFVAQDNRASGLDTLSALRFSSILTPEAHGEYIARTIQDLASKPQFTVADQERYAQLRVLIEAIGMLDDNNLKKECAGIVEQLDKLYKFTEKAVTRPSEFDQLNWGRIDNAQRELFLQPIYQVLIEQFHEKYPGSLPLPAEFRTRLVGEIVAHQYLYDLPLPVVFGAVPLDLTLVGDREQKAAYHKLRDLIGAVKISEIPKTSVPAMLGLWLAFSARYYDWWVLVAFVSATLGGLWQAGLRKRVQKELIHQAIGQGYVRDTLVPVFAKLLQADATHLTDKEILEEFSMRLTIKEKNILSILRLIPKDHSDDRVGLLERLKAAVLIAPAIILATKGNPTYIIAKRYMRSLRQIVRRQDYSNTEKLQSLIRTAFINNNAEQQEVAENIIAQVLLQELFDQLMAAKLAKAYKGLWLSIAAVIPKRNGFGASSSGPVASTQWEDLREYQPGDDTRAIAWRNSARLPANKYLVKTAKDVQPTIALNLDLAQKNSGTILLATILGLREQGVRVERVYFKGSSDAANIPANRSLILWLQENLSHLLTMDTLERKGLYADPEIITQDKGIIRAILGRPHNTQNELAIIAEPVLTITMGGKTDFSRISAQQYNLSIHLE